MLYPEPTVRIRLVGEQLRRHREFSKLTIAQAARRIGVTASKLSRMETGKLHQKCDEVAGLLGVYGVTGEDRRHLLELAQIANRPGLWQPNTFSYAQRVATLQLLESHAIRLTNFESGLIPGLLQTVPYIQALMRGVGRLDDEDEIGERVASRVHRQAILRKSGAPDFLAVIAENALHNIVGDKEIMRDQLIYLTEAAQRRNIMVRVIPRSATNHAGFEGPFHRLQFPDRAGVILVGNRTGSIFLEEDADLMTFNLVLVDLLSVALSPEESIASIQAVAASME